MTGFSSQNDKFGLIAVQHNEAEELMRMALREAEAGMALGEIPIGAVVARKTRQGLEVLGIDHNRNIQLDRHIAHAELNALENCKTDSANIRNLILVSTLEPCIMCFSAAIISGIHTMIFALPSPADAGPSRVQMINKASAVMPDIIGGVLSSESRLLFEKWRAANRQGVRHWDFVSRLLALTSDG